MAAQFRFGHEDYKRTITHPDGWSVDVHIGHDGKITWAADWAKLPDLEQAGVIGHKFYGPDCYGHTDWIYLGT